jgi:hypothetical protein
MRVAFPVSLRIGNELRERYATRGGPEAVRVRLRMQNGQMYGQTGRIDFIDTQVDRNTDTILVRASIPNPPYGDGTLDRPLIDGMFVTAVVEGAEPCRPSSSRAPRWRRTRPASSSSSWMRRTARSAARGARRASRPRWWRRGCSRRDVWGSGGGAPGQAVHPGQAGRAAARPARRQRACRRRTPRHASPRLRPSRPRLAIVISILLTIAGRWRCCASRSPVPEHRPPPRSGTARSGAAAAVVERRCAAIESSVNGADRMIYMRSNCANDGTYTLSVTFALGTDPDIATVNVNNRDPGRAGPAAAGGAAGRRDGAQAILGGAAVPLHHLARRARAIRCSCRTTRPST